MNYFHFLVEYFNFGKFSRKAKNFFPGFVAFLEVSFALPLLVMVVKLYEFRRLNSKNEFECPVIVSR